MVPDMELAQRCWIAVRRGDVDLARGVMETVREKNMAPWYAHLCQQHPDLFQLDEELLADMKKANEADAKRITEVRAALGGAPVPRAFGGHAGTRPAGH